MQIRKAVITAAGKNQRTLPLQSLVDRDGVTKTALAIIIEEMLHAGIEQIGVVISPGDEAGVSRGGGGRTAGGSRSSSRRSRSGMRMPSISARSFCADDPFLLLVGDHLSLSATEKGLRAAARGNRACGEVRGLRGAIDAREQAAVLRRGRRAARPERRSGSIKSRRCSKNRRRPRPSRSSMCPVCAPAITSAFSACTC